MIELIHIDKIIMFIFILLIRDEFLMCHTCINDDLSS